MTRLLDLQSPPQSESLDIARIRSSSPEPQIIRVRHLLTKTPHANVCCVAALADIIDPGLNPGDFMMSRSVGVRFVLVLYGIAAYAQNTTGSIGGVVRDAAGGVVPGANVRVTNTG